MTHAMWGERNCLSFETAVGGFEPPSPRLTIRSSTARPLLPNVIKCFRKEIVYQPSGMGLPGNRAPSYNGRWGEETPSQCPAPGHNQGSCHQSPGPPVCRLVLLTCHQGAPHAPVSVAWCVPVCLSASPSLNPVTGQKLSKSGLLIANRRLRHLYSYFKCWQFEWCRG